LQDAELAVRYDLTLAVEKIEQLSFLNKEGERQGRKVKVHLKYDTGMRRLGVKSLEELEKLLMVADKLEYIEIDGAFSHFACPEKKKARISAKKKFLLANNLVKRYNNKANCHICASGGFLTGVVGDMVRIGILLYGYKPFASDFIKVRPIMKVIAPVVNTRILKKGERALYGLKKAKKTLPLSLVRVGYADGFIREGDEEIFSSRCMDLTQYKGVCEEDGFAVILLDADKKAKAHRTISYEVLVNATVRAEKIYKN
jgi:alanine racemase